MAITTGTGGDLIDIRAARPRRIDGLASACARFTAARRSLGLERPAFADLLSKHVGWPVPPEAVREWEEKAAAPGDILVTALELAGSIQQALSPGLTAGDRYAIVDHYDDLQSALADVVIGAHKVLAVTGSRSRDPDYLALIERTLADRPALTHYRVLYGPPRHNALRNHLIHLVGMDRPRGTINIGILRDLLRDQERFLCVSEIGAVIVIPSLTSIANFDTALVIDDPDLARRYVGHIRQAYLSAEPIPDSPAVQALEVVR